MALPGEPEGGSETIRRRTRQFWPACALLAAIATVGCVLAMWQATQPFYRNYLTEPVGPEKMRLSVSYPSDWSVIQTSFTPGDNSIAQGAWIRLERNPARGIEKWLSENVYHVAAKAAATNLVIQVLHLKQRSVDLDRESDRLGRLLEQSRKPGDTLTYRKTACPMGPALTIDMISGSQSPAQCSGAVLVFPTVAEGRSIYEVGLHFMSIRSTFSRDRQTALEVVSRLRLVKDIGTSPEIGMAGGSRRKQDDR